MLCIYDENGLTEKSDNSGVRHYKIYSFKHYKPVEVNSTVSVFIRDEEINNLKIGALNIYNVDNFELSNKHVTDIQLFNCKNIEISCSAESIVIYNSTVYTNSIFKNILRITYMREVNLSIYKNFNNIHIYKCDFVFSRIEINFTELKLSHVERYNLRKIKVKNIFITENYAVDLAKIYYAQKVTIAHVARFYCSRSVKGRFRHIIISRIGICSLKNLEDVATTIEIGSVLKYRNDSYLLIDWVPRRANEYMRTLRKIGGLYCVVRDL